jgi:hypothetical protein
LEINYTFFRNLKQKFLRSGSLESLATNGYFS